MPVRLVEMPVLFVLSVDILPVERQLVNLLNLVTMYLLKVPQRLHQSLLVVILPAKELLLLVLTNVLLESTPLVLVCPFVLHVQMVNMLQLDLLYAAIVIPVTI
jgi:hypothetical protein